jgi:hypothetical protein
VYLSIKKNAIAEMKPLCDIVEYSECDIKTAEWCLQFYLLGYDYRTNYNDAINIIVGLITSCDLDKIEDIRDIFFNIWITNFEGVKIIRDIVKQIINSCKMTEECKLNIIIKTSEIEYNLLRCRRKIIHFDTFVTQIMKIMKDHNNPKRKAITNSTNNTNNSNKNNY